MEALGLFLGFVLGAIAFAIGGALLLVEGTGGVGPGRPRFRLSWPVCRRVRARAFQAQFPVHSPHGLAGRAGFVRKQTMTMENSALGTTPL